jgi:hypothetical protein
VEVSVAAAAAEVCIADWKDHAAATDGASVCHQVMAANADMAARRAQAFGFVAPRVASVFIVYAYLH